MSQDISQSSLRRPVTIQDVARQMGVAPITVSCALNGTGRVKEETRQAILKAAREMGYRPNRTARTMRSNQTRSIGFVTCNFSNYGELNNYRVYPFVVGMSHFLTERSYHACMVEVKELERGQNKDWPQILQERFFDGLVVHFGLSPEAQELLPEFDVPVVWWDSGRMHSTNCVVRDEREVTCQLIRQLVERGHSRILYRVDEYNWGEYTAKRPVHYSFSERYESYSEEMRRCNLEERVVVGTDLENWVHVLRDADAVIIGAENDLPFITEAAHLTGRSVLRDLSVAALDCEERLPATGIVVGGMTYDRYFAGQTAAQMLLNQIEQPDRPEPSIKLSGKWLNGHTVHEVGVRG